MLEIPLLDSKIRNFAGLRLHLSDNYDPDTLDLARYSLRVSLPDGQVTHTYVPYDIELYQQNHGQIVIRAAFKAQPGENRLELRETSGDTYGRACHYDYLRVLRLPRPEANPPTVELEPLSGFIHRTVYDCNRPAELGVNLFNLQPGSVRTVRVRVVDYFDRVRLDDTRPVLAGPGGRCTLRFACPAGESGHLRATAELLHNGEAATIQMGQKSITRFLFAVRPISPLTDEEIDKSFIGICGLSMGSGLFDPYALRPDAERRETEYRAFRRILQVHHERYHSLSWAHLEQKENEFRWDYWDQIFAREKAERIRLQVGIMCTPEWLLYKYYPERKELKSVHQKLYSCPPDMAKWADVCAKIAERYRDQIADFEIWNEPSEQSLFWYKADAKDYFNLVKSAAEAIRRVAPKANIVAETVWARQPEFWNELYKLGVGQYVDYPADHYMRDDRIRQINQFLDRVGRGKGLICNEAKCAATSGFGAGEINETARRTAAREMLRNMIYANANGILRIYEFEILSCTWRKYGMLSPVYEPRYSFCSLKTLVNRTAGAEFYKTLNLGDKLEGYIYRYFNPQRATENGGDHALFLFNRDAAARPLRLYVNAPRVTVVDLMDNAHEVETYNGVLAWELTADPIIVIGADLAALEKQGALVIEPAAPSAKPGEALRFALALAPGQTGPAEVEFSASALPLPGPLTIQPGQPTPIELPLKADQAEGVYPLEISARLPGANGPIPVYRQLNATVARIGLGENLFTADTFAPERKEWQKWGEVKLTTAAGSDGLTVARLELDKPDGAGGLTAAAQTVIPGARYHVMFRARGQGTIRLQLKKSFEHDRKETDLNLIFNALKTEWTLYDADWTAPLEARTAQFGLYLWHEKGWFETVDFRLLRIPANQPVNRLLFAAAAKPAGEIQVDGKLDEWRPDDFTAIDPNLGARLNGYTGPEDLAARFAAKWRDQTLYFAAVVTDDVQTDAPEAKSLWQGDSLQLDFETANRNTATDTTQFSFGLLAGRPASFRHKTIPTEDIVPAYTVGADPDGVAVAIRREGQQTFYEIAIAARAICPTYRIETGQAVAFSFLVNDNDGAGRKGWLEWSSGIGAMGGSALFGTLKIE